MIKIFLGNNLYPDMTHRWICIELWIHVRCICKNAKITY